MRQVIVGVVCATAGAARNAAAPAAAPPARNLRRCFGSDGDRSTFTISFFAAIGWILSSSVEITGIAGRSIIGRGSQFLAPCKPQ
ncbi:MAG TPA: hypothetical protein VFZ28_06850 [Burkholderiaceae bacterium]|nr:hypothetical protein [Burkholderiaceae bacterium]